MPNLDTPTRHSREPIRYFAFPGVCGDESSPPAGQSSQSSSPPWAHLLASCACHRYMNHFASLLQRYYYTIRSKTGLALHHSHHNPNAFCGRAQDSIQGLEGLPESCPSTMEVKPVKGLSKARGYRRIQRAAEELSKRRGWNGQPVKRPSQGAVCRIAGVVQPTVFAATSFRMTPSVYKAPRPGPLETPRNEAQTTTR